MPEAASDGGLKWWRDGALQKQHRPREIRHKVISTVPQDMSVSGRSHDGEDANFGNVAESQAQQAMPHNTFNDTSDRLDKFAADLPGWHLPLDCYDIRGDWKSDDAGHGDPRLWRQEVPELPHTHIYDSTWQFWITRRTVLENHMMGVIGSITSRPDWVRKFNDTAIRARWLNEMRTLLASIVKDCSRLHRVGHKKDNFHQDIESARKAVVERAVAFCLDELASKVAFVAARAHTTTIGLGGADIVKSDTAVPRTLKRMLEDSARRLESAQLKIDWQPGQEHIVRNLIHPSTSPLQYGQSRIVNSAVPLRDAFAYSCCGNTIPVPEATQHYSAKSQWLPAAVKLNERGRAEFTSPINGLEFEKHPGLYDSLAKLVDCSLPLWSQCLAIGRGNNPRRCPCDSEENTYTIPSTIPNHDTFHTMAEWDDSPSGWWADPSSVDEDTMKRRPHRYPSCPGPIPFQEFQRLVDETPKIDLSEQYQFLQVIVKMSTIYLTPERPEYAGGTWHVEGLANEHICATAIYYYDFENITTTSVAFRTSAVMGLTHHPQMFTRGLERVYGTKLHKAPATQQLPSVVNPEGRLLVFPNVFQHFVPKFRLTDPTKPGHRKIVVLWLVNPQKRIISTAHVPPQQREPALQRLTAMLQTKNLPRSLATRIALECLDDLPDEYEARKLQEELMAERSVSTAEYGKINREYNFCEH